MFGDHIRGKAGPRHCDIFTQASFKGGGLVHVAASCPREETLFSRRFRSLV